MSMTDEEKRVVAGTTWDQFCDALKEAGKIVRSDKAPQDSFNQAEGYRYLARLLRGGLEGFLEFRVGDFQVAGVSLFAKRLDLLQVALAKSKFRLGRR